MDLFIILLLAAIGLFCLGMIPFIIEMFKDAGNDNHHHR